MDLAVGVAGVQAGAQAGPSGGVEVIAGRDYQRGDATEGVVFAPAVAGGLLLHAAADVVDDLVGQTNQVETVDHERGMGQVGGHRTGIAPMGVEGDYADAR